MRGAFLSVAIVSAVTNVLMLTGPLFMMQVYDRVLTGRSVPTLVALSLLALSLYGFLGLLEVIRARILSRIGDRLEEELGAATFHAVLTLPLRATGQDASRQATGAEPRRDLDTVRQFFAGAGPVAICDLPWLPFYLLLLFLFHPYLGFVALVGAVILIALTLCNETILRQRMRQIARLAETRGDLVEAGRRNARQSGRWVWAAPMPPGSKRSTLVTSRISDRRVIRRAPLRRSPKSCGLPCNLRSWQPAHGLRLTGLPLRAR